MTIEAEEVRVVLKDGTIMRWSGEQAAAIWNGMQSADGEYFSLCTFGYERAEHPTLAPVVTRPLRKVTEIDGDLRFREGIDTSCLLHSIESGTARSRSFAVEDLCPAGADDGERTERDSWGRIVMIGRRFIYRIEVEAEEVKP